MASSRGVSAFSVVLSFMILIVAFGCIAGGAFSLHKFDHIGAASMGVWAVYFVISSAVSIVAGFGRYRSWFAAAIGVHVFGLLLALAGTAWAAWFWALFAICENAKDILGVCVCDLKYNGWKVDCDDVDGVLHATAAVTILYIVLFILSFIASILGCVVVCCGKEKYRGGMYHGAYVLPVSNPNSMMMTRIEERRYIENDPYQHGDGYIQAPPQYREPSYIDYRDDRKQNGGYVEERYYNGYIEQYVDEKPYYENRGLPAPAHQELYVEDPSDDRFDGYYD